MHRSVWLGAATLVIVACTSGAPTPRATPAGGARLSDDDAERIAALLEAADTRRADTAVIDRGLASPSPFVRAFAARTAGQIGVSARVSQLRLLAADPDTAVAADALFALGVLHDSTAITVLNAALQRSPTIIAAAAWSLGELGETGRATLEAVLRTGQPTPALADVLQATGKLRPVPAALIEPYLTHADVLVRRSAVYAVTRSRVPAATNALIALSRRLSATTEPGAGRSDVDGDLRSYLARGLVKPVVPDSLVGAALAALRTLAADSHPHVRINAIRSLATYGASARSDLVTALRDPDANARIALAQSLGGVLDSATASWETAWRADTAFTYRRFLLATALRNRVRLAALDPASSDAWQRSSDWRRRAAAAEASGAGTDADIDAVAVPLLRDTDGRVRNAAYGAAVAWADSASASTKPYARSALRSAANDPDLFVRSTILDGLRPRARAADAAVALSALRRSSADADNDARMSALRVIVAAWRADSASFGPLRDSLAALSPPKDPIERNVGRVIGPFAMWPQSGVSPRPMSWYAEQVRMFVAPDRAGRPPRATISTSRGSVVVTLRGADAPLTVANFVRLARRGYYNGLAFHRVVPNFVAQDGDPRGDGSGGPGYAIRDELNRWWYDRGAVGMALSGPDTGGSQYFLTHSPQPHLDGHYTVFGHVAGGLDALDAIVQGDRILTVTIQ